MISSVSRRFRSMRILAVIALAAVLVLASTYAVHQYRAFKANIRGRMCVEHIQDLKRELDVYAAEHDDHYPDTISALYPEFVPDLQSCICPEMSEKYKRELGVPHPFSSRPTPEEIDSLSSYAVVPGLIRTDDPHTIIVYEKNDNHTNVKHVRATVGGIGSWDTNGQEDAGK